VLDKGLGGLARLLAEIEIDIEIEIELRPRSS
jgi:hypothetical protein